MYLQLLLGIFFAGFLVQPDSPARETICPGHDRVVDFRANNDPAIRRQQAFILKREVDRANTMVRLGPGVDLDFSDFPDESLPIEFGRCVTLTSIAQLSGTAPVSITTYSTEAGPPPAGEGRSANSEGPVLRFRRHRPNSNVFLAITCDPLKSRNDGVRISGFRLYGPSPGQQHVSDFGIRIHRCVDIEIANMEIAGWGGAGIDVRDDAGVDQGPATNDPGGRISRPDQILIHDNYIHNNQHPESPRPIPGCPQPRSPFCQTYGSLGYGVVTDTGAWARIYRNLFDNNRHSIAASADTGGYWAEHNLVLRGGGYHGGYFNPYTHSFDVHGTDCDGLCGGAGRQFGFYYNAFQYRRENDIKIRGAPELTSIIEGNVFALGRGGAIETSGNISIGPGNIFGLDTFGRYRPCDFDGDRADDLFLATGANWWYSSGGEFPWTFLAPRPEQLERLRFGDFDGDLRCDVVADHNGVWEMSSGGSGPWTRLGPGRFEAPFDQVRFGRFNPRFRDHRRNIMLRTTHAFWRRDDGQWFVTPLTSLDWRPVGSSRKPLGELAFGDFTGDGVTDVLAVVSGRWHISEGAATPWARLNANLRDPVQNLIVANMDADDNIDDLLRFDQNITTEEVGWDVWVRAELTWMRSRNGTGPWQVWRRYRYDYLASPDKETPVFGFAGRFGSAPGGGTLTIDPDRFGQFHDPAEAAAGRSPDWDSLFPY